MGQRINIRGLLAVKMGFEVHFYSMKNALKNDGYKRNEASMICDFNFRFYLKFHLKNKEEAKF